MSKVPVRLGTVARRPAGPPSKAVGSTSTFNSGPNLDEMRNLPAFEDGGVVAEQNPANASVGRVTDETVTIVGAHYETTTWKRKDGTYPENSMPELSLIVSYRRDGDEEGDRPYNERYKYGSTAYFAPSKDGQFPKVRPSAVKEGFVPRPRKKDAAMLFLQSIASAGGEAVIARIAEEGISAISGLRVHVRSQKVEGMSEKAKPVLLVDYIDGVAKGDAPASSQPEPAKKSKGATANAPAETSETSAAAIDALATESLLDLLSNAPNNTLTRANLAAAVIKSDAWKTHPERGAILARFREDSFLNQNAGWVVDGSSISLV